MKDEQWKKFHPPFLTVHFLLSCGHFKCLFVSSIAMSATSHHTLRGKKCKAVTTAFPHSNLVFQKCPMNQPHGLLAFVAIDDHGNLDLAG